MVFLRFYLKGCILTKTYPGGILTYILKYNLEESMFYRFPAMRGIQANSEYFVCMIPLGVLSKIFIEDSSDVLPEFRAQRKLNEQRIPEIRDYIINNRDSYVFSALAASVDEEIAFFPTRESGNIGELEVDMTATFLINDGQHRKAAIIEAIEFDESLKDETIALVLYRDKGLARSQQMFTDLNKHAVNTSKSLNTLYDSKDPMAVMTKQVVAQVPFLRKYTDKEKDNLANYAAKLFTLNVFYDVIAEYAKHDRAEFVRVVQEAQSSQQTAEVKKQRTRLATAKQRVSELEVLLCKIYEDNILGKLSDSRYATLDAQYEKEQSELTVEISVLEKAIKSYEKHEKDADRFIALIDKYENFDKLTIAMLNEFIEKILVHERDRKGSIQTTQEVEIYFNFVGRFVPPAFGEVELTPEELEEIRKREERKDRLHQNYLKRKANGKQKEYEERTKAKKKAEIEARKQAIRTEDIARGVFIPVSSLPQLGPRKGA